MSACGTWRHGSPVTSRRSPDYQATRQPAACRTRSLRRQTRSLDRVRNDVGGGGGLNRVSRWRESGAVAARAACGSAWREQHPRVPRTYRRATRTRTRVAPLKAFVGRWMIAHRAWEARWLVERPRPGEDGEEDSEVRRGAHGSRLRNRASRGSRSMTRAHAVPACPALEERRRSSLRTRPSRCGRPWRGQITRCVGVTGVRRPDM